VLRNTLAGSKAVGSSREQWGAVGSSQEQSGAVRSRSRGEQSEAVGISREQWGAVRSSKEQSGAVGRIGFHLAFPILSGEDGESEMEAYRDSMYWVLQ